MSVISSTLDIAKFLRERKGIKEEQSRYETEQEALERERRLKEQQIRQQMNIALQQAEREKGLWAPGREEKTGFTGALPYTVKGKEPGLQRQRLQTQLEGEKQRVAGFETPAQTREATGAETPGERRTAEQVIEDKRLVDQRAYDEKMAAIRQQYALELADLKGGEEEVVPFDESGGFNTQIFANIAGTLFPNYSFRDVYKNIGLEEVRKRIRFEAVANYGQNDPAKVKQIEDSLDEWLRFLFQMIGTLPEGEDPSFLEVLGRIGKRLTTPIGEEPGMTRRTARGIPVMKEEGPLPGVEFPVETESDYQAVIPEREKKERKIRDWFSWTKGNKRKSRSVGIPGLQTGQ